MCHTFTSNQQLRHPLISLGGFPDLHQVLFPMSPYGESIKIVVIIIEFPVSSSWEEGVGGGEIEVMQLGRGEKKIYNHGVHVHKTTI